MMFDLLEPRRLYSVSFNLASHTLSVVGTDHMDAIIFSKVTDTQSGKRFIRLDVNGDVTFHKLNAVKLISVDGLAGADTVILGGLHIPASIVGGLGDDKLSGGSANDTIEGGGGDDYCFGGKGADSITGGLGYDLLMGGAGSDVITPFSDGLGQDTISGGKGIDTIDYSTATEPLVAHVGGIFTDSTESDKLLVGIETIIGSAFDDVIVNSTPKPMLIQGGAGNDTLTGGSGPDTLDGGTGTDQLNGNGGADTFIANDGEKDTIDGGSGVDTADLIDAGIDVVTNVP
jgi:Ca2+-binding RTX toxin-like protein